MELDTYRIAALTAGCKAAHFHNSADVSASNAYSLFLACQEDLDNAKVPQGGRFALVTPAFLNYIKLSDNFIKESDMSQRMAITGVVGEIDGVYIIKAPSSYFPAGIQCIVTNRMVMPSPVKLIDYKIHENPPGINGALIEGRLRYDAFILDEKADAIAVVGNNGASQKSVTVIPSTAKVAPTGTIALATRTSPGNQAVTWVSSATTYATVSEAGVVTGVATGTATVSATMTVDGTAYTGQCVVVVGG